MKFNPKIVKGIFTLGAVVGVAATGYLAAKNGEDIVLVEDRIKEEIAFYDNKKDKAVHIVKSTPRILRASWKPLVAMGATYACMIASHKLTAKQIAALTATCAYVTRNRNYLEQKLKEYVSDEDLAKIRKSFAASEIVREKTVWGGPTVEVSAFCMETEEDSVLCYEDFFGRWFRCPKDHVLEAQKQLKHLYDDPYSICSYNDYYGLLGITMTKSGNIWRWKKDELSELHFTNTMLTPQEWGDYGPEGEYLTEPVYLLEVDTWPYPDSTNVQKIPLL